MSLHAVSRLIGPIYASDLNSYFFSAPSPEYFPNKWEKTDIRCLLYLRRGDVCSKFIITAAMFLESWTLWTLALAVLQPVHAEDTVSSGNYLIHRCNSGQPGSEASKLQSLLPQVYDGLQKVIADLQLGTASTHGYSTFFKDDSSKAEITQVFQQMAAGANVELHRAGINNGVYTRHPTFICANDVPETILIHSYCTRSNAPLVNWVQTELVALCPIFWMIPQQARSSDCPLVVANSLAPNDDRLLRNQEALLVGSLMHFYHKQNEQMVAAIADVSELSGSDSKLNAPTYALYYAGKRSTI